MAEERALIANFIALTTVVTLVILGLLDLLHYHPGASQRFGGLFAIGALTGRFIARRKHRTFCFVMACVECMFMPFGTVLGAFTIIVLMRQSVKALFGHTAIKV